MGEYSSTGWRDLQSVGRGLWVSTLVQGGESICQPRAVCG